MCAVCCCPCLKPVESSKTNRPKEDSLRSHKYIHEEENNNFSEEDEVLADDVLDYASKSNESEHTMYDGSYDGLSKADFSVVESIITRLGQSKSVATEDALYDDTSSESENNVPHAESHLERYLYSTPIDVDDDDDLTRVDSMIASSEAPGLVNCDESDDGISFDHLSHGDTLITSSVAPNPLHPDDNDEENINSPTQGEEITQNCISPLSKATSTQLLPRKLDISKWQAEANSKKSPTTSILYSPKRLDMSKFEKHGNQTTTKSVIRDNAVDQRSSQQKLQPKSLSPERTKLKNDINRLRQQILELEQRKKLPSTKVRGYVKPSDLVLPNSSTNVEVPIETGKHVLSDACTSTVICDAATESNHLDGECTTDGTENIVEVYTCSSLLRSTDSNTDGNDTIKFQVAVDKENQGTISICDITKNGDASKDEQLGEQRKECDRVLDDPAKISLKDDEQRRGDGDKEIDDHLKHPEKICRNDENTGSDGCVEDNGRILSEHIKVVSSERRESLDSAIMQYSVSTYGHESDFERSYDDASTQLFGSSIPKLKKNGTHDDDKQCDMMTKSISKAQVISSEIKLSESTIGMKPSNEHNNPNVIIEKQDVHPDLQSQQCDKNPDPVAYDVTKSRSGLDRIANFGGPLQSLKSVNDSIASQPKHETATHCTSFGQENSENSMARSNEVDANNRSIEATDFVHLLNLDPWNRESKLDEQQIFDMIEEKPSLCSHKYKFEGFHGFIYPLSALCALSASIAMIKRCYLAFPQAITKADAWVGTSLHYACSYHASLPIVEFLSKKHPLSLKAVNQFNRLPIHM